MSDPVTPVTQADCWKIGGVSVVGFSHIDEDILCQDALAFEVKDNGQLIAAVADGAGSARLSHIGAQAFVDGAVSKIYALSGSEEFDPENIAAELTISINETSERLLVEHGNEESDRPLSLRDFAATFLMVVADADGGAFFHVGDGAGTRFAVDDIASAVVSKPKNGEYANETYFVTRENWESHLRVTRFDGAFDTILLMSDGVTPMAMTKGCAGPFENFVTPVVGYLKNADGATGEAAVVNTLSAENVRAVTGDDKTLFWAIRTSS